VLAIDFCQEHFVKNGMIADIAFHKLDSDNPHFHVMLTTTALLLTARGSVRRKGNGTIKNC
jgi:hypothetical protein